MPFYDDPKEYLGYVKPFEIGAVIPIEFPHGMKFDIMSVMI